MRDLVIFQLLQHHFQFRFVGHADCDDVWDAFGWLAGIVVKCSVIGLYDVLLKGNVRPEEKVNVAIVDLCHTHFLHDCRIPCQVENNPLSLSASDQVLPDGFTEGGGNVSP